MNTTYRGWDLTFTAPWHCAYRDGKSLAANSQKTLRSMIDARASCDAS